MCTRSSSGTRSSLPLHQPLSPATRVVSPQEVGRLTIRCNTTLVSASHSSHIPSKTMRNTRRCHVTEDQSEHCDKEVVWSSSSGGQLLGRTVAGTYVCSSWLGTVWTEPHVCHLRVDSGRWCPVVCAACCVEVKFLKTPGIDRRRERHQTHDAVRRSLDDMYITPTCSCLCPKALLEMKWACSSCAKFKLAGQA